MTKKVLISTGGSGGHVVPAITIYNHLKNIHETFIHAGVNTNLLPTTGMTLPFLSYGGSSIISTSILAGIILNLTKRKIS